MLVYVFGYIKKRKEKAQSGNRIFCEISLGKINVTLDILNDSSTAQ